jgi:hypothetical protein
MELESQTKIQAKCAEVWDFKLEAPRQGFVLRVPHSSTIFSVWDLPVPPPARTRGGGQNLDGETSAKRIDSWKIFRKHLPGLSKEPLARLGSNCLYLLTGEVYLAC